VILVDTNVLYALADRRDKHHARCADWLQRTSDVLMVPATVLAETCYLIDRTLGPTAEAAFLDSVGMGPDCTFQQEVTVLADRLSQRWPGYIRRGQPRDRSLRVIVDDQRGKQPADIPGRGYLAPEACAEPRFPGQLRPDNLNRHQPAAS
jgi:predicted nucleic acid-binding protein